MSFLFLEEPVVQVQQVVFRGKRFSVLCFEESDTFTGGNKWYKLRENIRLFKAGNYTRIVSFGGDHSNHIAALAAAGAMEKIPVTGIIRGERALADTKTLRRAEEMGMELKYVSRTLYRQLREEKVARAWLNSDEAVYLIPEGGANDAGTAGCREMAKYIPASATDVWLAVGTGTTFAGIGEAMKENCCLHGVKVVEARQEQEIGPELMKSPFRKLYDQYTFGGYARPSEKLDAFVEDWNRETGIRIEQVYTGRTFFAALDSGHAGSKGEPPVLIHTGGLQYCSD